MTWLLLAALAAAPVHAAAPPVAPAGSEAFAPDAIAPDAAAALAAADARTLAGSSLSDRALDVLVRSADWRVRSRAAAARVWRDDPARADLIATVAPVYTRSGAVRYTDRALRFPDAAPLLVERIASGADPAEDRAALVEALRLSGGDWSAAAAGLLAEEADAGVRAQLAGALRYADAEDARDGLTRATRDPSPDVRAAALRAIGGRSDGADYAAVVTAALGDPDPSVRRFAARAAGWLALPETWSGLELLLSDADADVRLTAIEALERLDGPRTAALPAIAALRGDRDTRVARAAARLVR